MASRLHPGVVRRIQLEERIVQRGELRRHSFPGDRTRAETAVAQNPVAQRMVGGDPRVHPAQVQRTALPDLFVQRIGIRLPTQQQGVGIPQRAHAPYEPRAL